MEFVNIRERVYEQVANYKLSYCGLHCIQLTATTVGKWHHCLWVCSPLTYGE